MQSKLLTIVIPVYRVEEYIRKCLDSLLPDNPCLMERLEVIIVNDGTPDNSAEISREYVRKYPDTFRQIDKENGGHGSAWNVGLKEATAKYIRFLDSDDWFTNIDSLLNDLARCDADIVFNPFIKEYAYEGRAETIIPPASQSSLSRIESSMWGTSQWGYDSVGFWSCTYKTDILSPLQPIFAEKTMYDDYILTWVPLVYGRTYTTLDYPVYHYLIGRPGQTMSMTQQRKGAESYCKCFEQYETVRSRINPVQIPEDLLRTIDLSVTSYAMFIFPYMLYLPYLEAKDKMHYLWDNYLRNYSYQTKLSRRYDILPFSIFSIVENLRRRINRMRTR